ncbi:MAG TPA: VTT domain-containing protein [Anaeromyxobacter sp.]|nr:VTT domain-containing protein [Anaeromyxobacter sp.]
MLYAPAGSTSLPDPVAARGRARFWLGLGTLLAVLMGFQLLGPQELLYPLVEGTRGAGWPGAALLGLLYVPAALLGVPLALLTFTAGWFFGPAIGAMVAVPACTAASCAAFAVGRAMSGDPLFLARGRGKLAAVARATTTVKGFWAIVLLRLLPVAPFSLLNFAFGATPISPATYALATLIGCVPACLGFSYAGAWASGMR